jgi:hypothetical protein
MIDFVKIKLKDTDPEILLNNPLLVFRQEFIVETGELLNKRIAEYRGMKFYIHVTGTIIISGSLHKFMNNGRHNHNDFKRSQLTNVINEFCSIFNLYSGNCTLINLEVGANVTPPIPTKELLKYLFMHFRNEYRFADINKGTYKQVTYSEYLLKAYDKSAQYSLDIETFRFEIKMMGSRMINRNGVRTLDDLYNKLKLEKLGNLLLDKWRESLLYDPAITNELFINSKEHEKYVQWGNPVFWFDMANNKDIHRNAFSKEMKKYREINDYHPENLHLKVLKIIYSKLGFLLHT